MTQQPLLSNLGGCFYFVVEVNFLEHITAMC
jgi:hypothetical protein